MIAAYVSGHGFGHSTRVAEVLRALRQRQPELALAVVTSAPEALFRAALPGAFEYRRLECDVGLAQRDALHMDEPGTIARWRAFQAQRPARVEAEARWLRERGARLVLADIPPLAFDAAEAAGLPAVGLANFSWDWIYRHLSRAHPALGEAAEAAARSYAKATLLLRLPFAGDLTAFPRIQDLPLVARRPTVGRHEARRRLGLPQGTLVLLSFGGIGLPGFDPQVLATLPYRFLTAGEWPVLPDNVLALPKDALGRAGLGYEDLVGAAEVVVTKPGYGIVTDAIGAGTPLVYTERGDFPEYPILVAGMQQHLPCAHVSNADLLAGRLREAVEQVLAMPVPPRPDLSGAAAAAERLLRIAGH